MSQRNQIVFEVGVRRREATGLFTSRTLAIHPLAVKPDSVRIQDVSRSTREQTSITSQLTRGGRQLRTWAFTGTFGVDVRGAGLVLGTGEQRRQRFYEEVVRLPDASDVLQLHAYQSAPLKTPGLADILRGVDPAVDQLYVNVYDFWNGIVFEGLVRSFSQTRAAGRAAASGATWYDLTVEELGPLVADGIAGDVLVLFKDALVTWQTANDVVRSYNVDDLANALLDPLATTALQGVTESVRAVRSQVDGVTSVARGGPASDAVTTFWQSTRDLEASAADLRASVRAEELQPSGQGWANFAQGDPTVLRYQQRADLVALADAARFQRFAGSLLGLSDEQWQALLAGTDSPRSSQGARTYTVSLGETGADIEQRTGVRWIDILAANNLLPQEAERPGTELRIPPGAVLTPRPIPGLPTLDSHTGTSAWGRDLTPDLAVANGRLVVIEGEDLLQQGIDILLSEFGEAIMAGASTVPSDYRAQYLAERVRQVLGSDPRVDAVSEVTADLDGQGASVTLQAKIEPINGSTVRVGG